VPQGPSTRSIAFDPAGGFLVGGTVSPNKYAVGSIRDGQYHGLYEAENDLLALVRPSPDGRQIAVLARAFDPKVIRLTVPR
jgi:hypothetical protein